MRELAILTFQTLDGVMQAPSMPEEDRSGGFDRGGWAAPWWDEVMAQVGREAMAQPYDLLLGRKTYELFAAHFADKHDGDPAGERLNTAVKYVASNTASDFSWKNTRLLTGDIPSEVARLKREDGPLLQVHGSQALIQSLLAHDLIDEFRLWTFPVIAGPGKRLFSPQSHRPHLQLIKSGKTAGGILMGIYRRQDQTGQTAA